MAKLAGSVWITRHLQGIQSSDRKREKVCSIAAGRKKVRDGGLANGSNTTIAQSRSHDDFLASKVKHREGKGGGSRDRQKQPAADVYSFVAIFDLFAGRPPFLGESRAREKKKEEGKRKRRDIGARGAEARSGNDCAKCPRARTHSATNLACLAGRRSGTLAGRSAEHGRERGGEKKKGAGRGGSRNCRGHDAALVSSTTRLFWFCSFPTILRSTCTLEKKEGRKKAETERQRNVDVTQGIQEREFFLLWLEKEEKGGPRG